MVFTPNSNPDAPSRLANPGATPFPPTLRQDTVDDMADHLTAAAAAIDPAGAAQARADDETYGENMRQYQARQSEAQRKEQGIEAARKQQEALNKRRETEVQNGDHVVIDLEQLDVHQHTVGIRNAMRHLLHAGAHKATGQVSNIESGPTGRVLTVQTGHATYTVPEQLATRADLYDED